MLINCLLCMLLCVVVCCCCFGVLTLTFSVVEFLFLFGSVHV